MVSRIAVIAVTGLTVCAVCIGAAAAIGARDFGSLDIPFFGGPSCGNIPGATATSRDLDWDGSNTAGIAIRGVANYAPGSGGDRLHATGNPQALAHLRIHNGIVEDDCRGWRERDSDLIITLPGRHFDRFVLTGTGKLNLERLDQPSLDIKMAGVGTIKASGKVDDLTIDMAGVSHADFSQVTGRKAEVKMAGVNTADIAPTDEANVNIAGPSEVTLHSNPSKLDTRIAGPGRIHKVSP